MKYIVLLILILTCTESFAQKITALTEDTSPTTDDLTVIVNDPAGTPTTKKSTLANIFKSHNLYTDVNNNLGIGTSIPQGGLTVMNGNFGIGTWIPTRLLHVNGNALVGASSLPASATASLIAVGDGINEPFEQFNAGTDTTGMLVWGGSTATTGNAVRIRGNASNGGASYIFSDFSTTEGDLVLGTYTNRANQLYLDDGGNIGVGTTIPGGKFVVMSGNVGIGTWRPGALLHIGTGTGSNAVMINSNTISINSSTQMNSNGFVSSTGYTSSAGYTANANSLTTGQIINGASSSNSFTGDMIRMTYTGNNSGRGANIGIGTLGTGDALFINQQGTGNIVRFDDVNSDSSPFIINADGNVGIGTVTAGAVVAIPSLKSTTGTRYLCIDTVGNISSSASACSGT